MELTEEMNELISVNYQKFWLLTEEPQMLNAEADGLVATEQNIREWVDRVNLENKDSFDKWSISWFRRCESYFNQAEVASLEFRTKAVELNDLTGDLLDLRREQGAEKDEDVQAKNLSYTKGSLLF